MIVDEEIKIKIKQKDNTTYLSLYNEYNRLIYHVINAIVNNPQDSKDLVQEAFLKMVNRIDSFDSQKSDFKTWFCVLSKNLAVDFLRKKITTVEYLDNNCINKADKIEFSIGELASILDHIEYDIIMYRYQMGLTQKEIADLLHLTIDIVKKKSISANKKIKDYIKEAK